MSGIKHHELQLGAYVIALSSNGTDIFDLIPSYMLSEKGYKGHDIKILGLATSKKDAIDLTERMIMDVYRATGDVDVRGYFS